jgi:aminomethyltransferase
LAESGVDRKLVGIDLEGDQLRAELSQVGPALHDGEEVGRVTDAVWSPGLEKNIGYVWLPIGLAEPGSAIDVLSENGEELTATVASLPFVDPKKKAPAGDLKAS